MRSPLSRIPAVARRKARALAEHRLHMEFLAALRRAAREQTRDPEMIATMRRYADLVPVGSVGRHRLPGIAGS